MLAIARLDFLEKAHIFNGDHRLIGKRLEEFDLLVGKGPHLGAADHERPDRFSLPQQWSSKNRMEAELPGHRAAGCKLVSGRGQIVNMDGRSIQHGAAGDDVAHYRQAGSANRDRPVMCPDGQSFATPQIDRCVKGIAEPGSTLGDGVKHGLNVRGGRRDHSQDRAGCRLLLTRFIQFLDEDLNPSFQFAVRFPHVQVRAFGRGAAR